MTATPITGAGTPNSSFAGSDGRYSVGGLAPGKYRVEFSSLCVLSPGGFVSQWFDGKTTRGQATPVTVASGKSTAGIDATLAADGGISGSVLVRRLAQGRGLRARLPEGRRHADGRRIRGQGELPDQRDSQPGQYAVEFTSGCGAASYRTQWFDGAASRSGATPVTVKVGSVTTAIDAH